MSSTNNSSGEPPPAVRVLGGWASPFTNRVVVALKLKGVEHELLQETVGKKSELLLRSNPVHKKIPVLLHHGKPLAESLVIVEYIDEVWPASNGAASAILPRDPHGRAVERFWARYVDDKVRACTSCFFCLNIFFCFLENFCSCFDDMFADSTRASGFERIGDRRQVQNRR